MTKKELIEALAEFHDDDEIAVLDTWSGALCEIEEVDLFLTEDLQGVSGNYISVENPENVRITLIVSTDELDLESKKNGQT